MPRIAYSEAEREQVREALLTEGLALFAKQGIQHTTVEQIYRAVGISRTFFYSFFPTKEDFVLEVIYFQQPRVIAHARRLMADAALSPREALRRFLYTCCYGEKSGIAVLSIAEQQFLFGRLSPESHREFQERQMRLFGTLLETFGIPADAPRIKLFTNLCLAVIIIRKAIPDALPLFFPEAADETVTVQIESILDCLDELRTERP